MSVRNLIRKPLIAAAVGAAIVAAPVSALYAFGVTPGITASATAPAAAAVGPTTSVPAAGNPAACVLPIVFLPATTWPFRICARKCPTSRRKRSPMP